MKTEVELLRGQVEVLQAQLDQALTVNQQLNAELKGRAKPTLGELIDTLNDFATNAEQGNEPAREVLKRFEATLQRARDAASKITVIRNPNGN